MLELALWVFFNASAVEPTEFKHMPEVRDCRLCHTPKSFENLVLLDGKVIARGDSARLCAQCHGVIAREWRRGLHGRQTGKWTGEFDRALCVKCHDPHAPKFKSMTAAPPPQFPHFGIRKSHQEKNHE